VAFVHAPPPPSVISRAVRSSAASHAPTDVIAIHVTQATPNVSPSCSLRSFSGEGSDLVPGDLSPTSSLRRRKGKDADRRRVSFSEDSQDLDDDADDSSGGSRRRASPRHALYQHIPAKNLLQVPGQECSYSVPSAALPPTLAPPLSPEALVALTSSAARRRRSTRLMKVGSFCSITSEGSELDEIFLPNGQLRDTARVWATPAVVAATIMKTRKQSSGDSTSASDGAVSISLPAVVATIVSPATETATDTDEGRRRSVITDPLSEYSEFQQDNSECSSEISEMFGGPLRSATGPALEAQGTLSEQCSIKSLSIDEDAVPDEPTKDEEVTEVTVVATQKRNLEYDDIMRRCVRAKLADENEDRDDDLREANLEDEELYASSSCSISIGSDAESSHHIITVPVTIEHPPPDVRLSPPPPPPIASTASSSPSPPSGIRPKAPTPRAPAGHDSGLDTDDIAVMSRPASSSSELVRMVLVRDVGVQVCGDSPSLNRTKRFPHHIIVRTEPRPQPEAAVAVAAVASGPEAHDDRTDKPFITEILF
jgi:hypothetical protein